MMYNHVDISALKRELLIAIESQHRLGDDDPRDILEDLVDEVCNRGGPERVHSALLEILKDRSHSNCWYLAASAMSWVLEDYEGLPCHWAYVVAVLYRCLEFLPDLDANLPCQCGDNIVWTIAQTVKGVGYMSDWDPHEDPEVLQYMERLKGEELGGPR